MGRVEIGSPILSACGGEESPALKGTLRVSSIRF